MKKLVIFGFDGTIADTSPGILYCLNTTASSMGYQPVEHERMYGTIGMPLVSCLKNLYNMKDDEIEYAVNNYSKLYSMKGKEMFLLYDGIKDVLTKLKQDGFLLAIATEKHEMYTKDMLEAHDIAKFFDVVCATDVGADLNKSRLISMACDKLNVSVEDSIYIGDSYVDAIGAAEIGMDFAAVLYGWGFRSKSDAEPYNCKAYFENAEEIYNKLTVI
jgi:phosphoglycolate phosphatase